MEESEYIDTDGELVTVQSPGLVTIAQCTLQLICIVVVLPCLVAMIYI